MRESQHILVTGASGYVGGRLVPALLDRGYTVRVLARTPAKIAKRGWKKVDVVQGDALDLASLSGALDGIDAAFYLIHSMTSFGEDFAQKDITCAENFASACEQAGVKQIIYLGGLGSAGGQLSKHLQSRQDVGQSLRRYSVPVTELRAAVVVGSGSASFEIIRDLSRQLPVMICPKWVYSKCEPIAVRQLLAYLIGCLEEKRTLGEILEVGGGEVLTYADLLRQCGQEMGRKIRIIPVPVLTPRLSSYWLNLVTSVPLNLARPLVEGLRNDVICTDFRIRKWIEVPKLSYRESVRLALEKDRNRDLQSRWSDATSSRANQPIDESHFSYTDERSTLVATSKEQLFSVIEQVGGDNGWFHADWLWRLRATFDWLIGGVGMRRGRPGSSTLCVGDPVDFWRVEERLAPAVLTLRAEMKLPGTARLTFLVDQEDDGAKLTIQAHFWPKGLMGRLYWYAVMPFHSYIFEGMLHQIKLKAEEQ